MKFCAKTTCLWKVLKLKVRRLLFLACDFRCFSFGFFVIVIKDALRVTSRVLFSGGISSPSHHHRLMMRRLWRSHVLLEDRSVDLHLHALLNTASHRHSVAAFQRRTVFQSLVLHICCTKTNNNWRCPPRYWNGQRLNIKHFHNSTEIEPVL